MYQNNPQKEPSQRAKKNREKSDQRCKHEEEYQNGYLYI